MKKFQVALSESKALRTLLLSYPTVGAMVYVVALPIVLYHGLLLEVLMAGPPRAWDGTGHYGIAQIYAQSIFPDTFGWTHAHFGGMPFPNFYPPLFFWCVALLTQTHLFSFLAAFKLVVLVPLLLMPAALWVLAWTVSDRNASVAFWSALLGLLPLLSPRFSGQMQWASGLDYFSTISIGMYTQPLGFVLLILWYSVYVHCYSRLWRFTLASLLLALAVLANFLNGITASLMVIATIVDDLRRSRGLAMASRDQSDDRRRALIAHIVSPLISLGLALFWLVPMLSTYDYFVTRPFTRVVFTFDMMVWFALAGLGVMCWLRRPTRAMWPYLLTCFILAFILIFAANVAPQWLPLQANRFSPVLNFLLAVPVGYAIATIIEKVRDWCYEKLPRFKPFAVRLLPYAFGLFLIFPVLNYYLISRRQEMKFLNLYQALLAFYPSSYGTTAAPDVQVSQEGSVNLPSALRESLPAGISREALLKALQEEHNEDLKIVTAAAASINGILRFARDHRAGRYAVEMPSQYRIDAAAFDARAINSYLGAQGNQTLTVVYREASPNSIFMYPQVGALSYSPDNFGFSSVLADDIDFAEQPLAKHLERIRMLGAQYLAIYSPKMKERLAQAPEIGARHDFGVWTIFELRQEPPLPIQALAFRPALLVSDFTVKGRRNDEHNYIRFAEEQFSDGWFDVLLVPSPARKLDDLGTLAELNQFGAIILDRYECDRCDLVYRQLRDFARNRPLILLMRDGPLFNRLRNSIDDFPQAKVIERVPTEAGAWLENFGSTRRYQSDPLRNEWAQIRSVLESNKIPSEPATVTGEVRQNSIQVNYDSSAMPPPEGGIPVLIRTSYHPNWQRDDGRTIYAANPMFTLIFARQSTRLTFARRWLDWLGLWISAGTLVGLVCFTGWHYGRRLRGKKERYLRNQEASK